MNGKLPVILAVGMAIATAGMFAWDYNASQPIAVREGKLEDVPESLRQTTPVIYKFNPIRKEFKLDNGTPCVMVWAPQRAQSAGISCDWDYNRRPNVN